MKTFKGIAACSMASVILLFAGCERTDIHKIEPIYKEAYQRVIPESVTVQRGDMEPVIRFKLTQNSLKYTTYSVEMDNLEFSELKVANGDYVKAGQVLVVFKSEKLQKEYEEKNEILEKDKLLLEHTKRQKEINYDPTKPDDEANKRIAERYDQTIAKLEDDIKLKQIEVAEIQRDMDKCIIKAKEDGAVTYISDAIKNGIVVLHTDILIVASGDVGFYVETREDYDFQIGAVYQAVAPTIQFDVEIYRIDENESGSRTLFFKPVSDDVVYVSNERFEIEIPREKLTDVVYVSAEYVYVTEDDRSYVYLLTEDGYRYPAFVEVDNIVEGQAIIKSGLVGGEEVTGK
ncbi:MAG: hypothetical protein J5856_06890 [Lachnospiraceae bacterium]|nr:hypothetical protein [Lachnospiraceae bacterium]